MDFKKTPVKCHQFSWASVTTFIENIWPMCDKGILIAKLMNVWCITRQHYSDVTECSTIATDGAYDGVAADGIAPLVYQWREFWLPFVDML